MNGRTYFRDEDVADMLDAIHTDIYTVNSLFRVWLKMLDSISAPDKSDPTGWVDITVAGEAIRVMLDKAEAAAVNMIDQVSFHANDNVEVRQVFAQGRATPITPVTITIEHG